MDCSEICHLNLSLPLGDDRLELPECWLAVVRSDDVGGCPIEGTSKGVWCKIDNDLIRHYGTTYGSGS